MLKEVVENRAVHVNFETAYRTCFNLVVWKNGNRVHKLVKLIMRIVSLMPDNLAQLVGRSVSDVVNYHNVTWCKHGQYSTSMEILREYQDRRRKLAAACIQRILPAVFQEWYYKPGGAYEMRCAKKPRWSQEV